MKNLLLIICLLSSLHTFSQSKDEKAVADAVESLRKAMISADKKALEDLAAPELSYGHSSGLIEDRATFVGNIVSGKSGFTSITLTDQTVTVVDNAAVVRHKFFAETNNSGTPGKINLAVLLVWQKQKGQWKLLARQTTRINP